MVLAERLRSKDTSYKYRYKYLIGKERRLSKNVEIAALAVAARIAKLRMESNFDEINEDDGRLRKLLAVLTEKYLGLLSFEKPRENFRKNRHLNNARTIQSFPKI